MFFSTILVLGAVGQVFGDFRVPILTTPLSRLPLPNLDGLKVGNEEYYDKATSYEVWQTPQSAGKNVTAFDLFVQLNVTSIFFKAKELQSRGELTTEKLEVRKLYDCSSCYYVKDADILAAVRSITQANLDDVQDYTIQELHNFAVAVMEKKFCFNMTLLEQKLNLSSLRVISDDWPMFVADIVAAAVQCRADILGLTQSELAQHFNVNLSTLLSYSMTQIETMLYRIANCTKTVNSFICTNCTGSTGSEAICHDVDECQESLDNCSIHATCTNTNGSFTCACDVGFSGNGVTCTDNDECVSRTDDCHRRLATCTNTIGSFTCSCNNGYMGNGRNCSDNDECALGGDDCNSTLATCSNTNGSFTCACNVGYTGDGRNCTDIDECNLGTDDCHKTWATCNNTIGSFKCTCNSGYIGNGRDCTAIEVILIIMGVIFGIIIMACIVAIICQSVAVIRRRLKIWRERRRDWTSPVRSGNPFSITKRMDSHGRRVNASPRILSSGFSQTSTITLGTTSSTSKNRQSARENASPRIYGECFAENKKAQPIEMKDIAPDEAKQLNACRSSEQFLSVHRFSQTSAITSGTTSSTSKNTQSAIENASPRTPSERTTITAIQNTVFDEEPHEGYLEPAMYAQLDSSKRVPVDENDQHSDLGNIDVITCLRECFAENNNGQRNKMKDIPRDEVKRLSTPTPLQGFRPYHRHWRISH